MTSSFPRHHRDSQPTSLGVDRRPELDQEVPLPRGLPGALRRHQPALPSGHHLPAAHDLRCGLCHFLRWIPGSGAPCAGEDISLNNNKKIIIHSVSSNIPQNT